MDCITKWRSVGYSPTRLDQRIVENSSQPLGVIITGNPIHQSVMLRGTIDRIGQLGYITNQEFRSFL